jgi:uncharacterized membrane protein YeaQ/YmgE (transglycosylase-associated protein family)
MFRKQDNLQINVKYDARAAWRYPMRVGFARCFLKTIDWRVKTMMSILVMIVVGFVVGLIARAILPGDQKLGLVMTAVLGIAGSLVANFAGSALGLYRQGDNAGWIASVIGAIILLFAYGKFKGKAGTSA